MSRSSKHTPIHGNTLSPSEQDDKKRASRAMRRETNRAIREDEDEDYIMPLERECSDVWDFSKDGKHYNPRDKRSMRK